MRLLFLLQYQYSWTPIVFPYPVHDVLTIKHLKPYKEVQVKIMDPYGVVRKDLFLPVNQGMIAVHTKDLASGLYYLELKIGAADRDLIPIVKN